MIFLQTLIRLSWNREHCCYRSEEWEVPCGQHQGYLVAGDTCYELQTIRVDSFTTEVELCTAGKFHFVLCPAETAPHTSLQLCDLQAHVLRFRSRPWTCISEVHSWGRSFQCCPKHIHYLLFALTMLDFVWHKFWRSRPGAATDMPLESHSVGQQYCRFMSRLITWFLASLAASSNDVPGCIKPKWLLHADVRRLSTPALETLSDHRTGKQRLCVHIQVFITFPGSDYCSSQRSVVRWHPSYEMAPRGLSHLRLNGTAMPLSLFGVQKYFFCTGVFSYWWRGAPCIFLCGHM